MTLKSRGQSNNRSNSADKYIEDDSPTIQDQSRFKSIFRRHSLAIFFILTYAISWSLWGSLFISAPNGYDVNGGASILLPALLGGIGSSICGVIVTRIAFGKKGLVSLFLRLKQMASPIWYMLAIFTAPLLVLITLALIGRGLESDIVSKIGLGVTVGITAALIEEFGWRGFALPALQQKYNSAIISSLTLGLIWGFWHIVPSYWGNGSQYGSLWLPSFLIFVMSLIAYTVFITWIFNKTRGNMLIAISLHGSYTGSQFILFPLTVTAIENILLTGIFMTLLWGVAALLIVMKPRGLTNQSAYRLQSTNSKKT